MAELEVSDLKQPEINDLSWERVLSEWTDEGEENWSEEADKIEKKADKIVVDYESKYVEIFYKKAEEGPI